MGRRARRAQDRHLQRRGGRGSFDPLVDDLATRLGRAPIAALSDAIVDALQALGRRLGADRLTLWDLRLGERQVVLVHEWSRKGCAHPLAAVAGDELPWLLQQLSEGRRVAFRSCATLPPQAFRERKFHARHGPRSAAILPLVVGDATVAMLVVGTIRRERSWGSAALALLERASVVLASAVVRERAHAASLRAEGRLAGVLEAGPDAILLVRPSGRIELANGRASALFLRTRQDLCTERLQDVLATPAAACSCSRPGGSSISAVPRAPEAGGRPGRSTLDALLASGEPLRMQARRGDGSTVPVEVTLREVRAPGDELFCCGIRDVSEDRRAREEALQLRDEIALRSRTAMLAEMGSGIAHELNQPLTAILSNSETAQRLLRSSGGETAELREVLQDVVNETRRAAEILGRMREMLRHRQAERVPVDVAELLGGVTRRFREEAVARSIRLVLEIVPGLPRVLGDPVQLEQVATNLVLNAFQAMGETSPPRTIVIRARPSQPDGVDVSVRDSGPGLDAEGLAHAFDPFFTTKPRGLGMGLPISRSIVEAHGGRLLARNNADRGATLELHLPTAPPAGAAAAERGRA